MEYPRFPVVHFMNYELPPKIDRPSTIAENESFVFIYFLSEIGRTDNSMQS